MCRILNEQPETVAQSLESLFDAGFRYPLDPVDTDPHPIVKIIGRVTAMYLIVPSVPLSVQQRVFIALWKMAGCPREESVVQALAEESPFYAMTMFMYPREEYE